MSRTVCLEAKWSDTRSPALLKTLCPWYVSYTCQCNCGYFVAPWQQAHRPAHTDRFMMNVQIPVFLTQYWKDDDFWLQKKGNSYRCLPLIKQCLTCLLYSSNPQSQFNCYWPSQPASHLKYKHTVCESVTSTTVIRNAVTWAERTVKSEASALVKNPH